MPGGEEQMEQAAVTIQAQARGVQVQPFPRAASPLRFIVSPAPSIAACSLQARRHAELIRKKSERLDALRSEQARRTEDLAKQRRELEVKEERHK
jgi:hypothetical protein